MDIVLSFFVVNVVIIPYYTIYTYIWTILNVSNNKNLVSYFSFSLCVYATVVVEEIVLFANLIYMSDSIVFSGDPWAEKSKNICIFSWFFMHFTGFYRFTLYFYIYLSFSFLLLFSILFSSCLLSEGNRSNWVQEMCFISWLNGSTKAFSATNYNCLFNTKFYYYILCIWSFCCCCLFVCWQCYKLILSSPISFSI